MSLATPVKILYDQKWPQKCIVLGSFWGHFSPYKHFTGVAKIIESSKDLGNERFRMRSKYKKSSGENLENQKS